MEEQFGPFRLLAKVGRGIGETFVAERSGVARRVFLRTLRPPQPDASGWIETFRSEASSVAALRHPNVVPVLEHGETSGTFWMALEHVDGADLRSVADSAREPGVGLPMQAVVHVATEVARALAHAHAAGILHREVSARHVLVGYDGRVMLGGFGRARVEHAHRIQSGAVEYRPDSMSPEQWTGDEVDARTDLFALGVMMFRLLSGEPPFRDGRAACEGQRAPIERVVRNVPAPLVAVVDRLLQPEKDERYATADEVVAALGAIPIATDLPARLGATARVTRLMSNRARRAREDADGEPRAAATHSTIRDALKKA